MTSSSDTTEGHVTGMLRKVELFVKTAAGRSGKLGGADRSPLRAHRSPARAERAIPGGATKDGERNFFRFFVRHVVPIPAVYIRFFFAGCGRRPSATITQNGQRRIGKFDDTRSFPNSRRQTTERMSAFPPSLFGLPCFSPSLFPARCDNRIASGLCRQSLQAAPIVVL
jgi:hypothetical protein